MYQAFGKRLFDVLLAVCSLFFLFPLLLVVALAIVIFDPGQVLFTQYRVGQHGKPFLFYKFRSMPVGTPTAPSDQLGEVRLSPVARLIRRTNIDELPQLLNILKGDMSVVGPRPPLLDQTELINRRRLNGSLVLRPGLTGLAQVRSFNGMTVKEKSEFDAVYAKSISLPFDLSIIIQTVVYLFSPPPIY